MEQSQQLTKLIEKALENGWKPLWDDDWEFSSFTYRGQCGLSTEYSIDPDYSIPLEVILFGDNLSFLKALVGEDIPAMTYERHFAAVHKLAELPDDRRIPWLYEIVFGEEQV